MKKLWILFIIVILGMVLRFYRLTEFPPHLNWDEVSHAYNAYSLLHTGRDQWSEILPVFNFRAFGDYPTTLNLYMTVPAIAIFGHNDFAARAPGALIGTLAVLMAFGVGYWWKKDWRDGVVMALVMAVAPWTLFTSRTVLQANWTIFLLLTFLVYYFKKKSLPVILILGLALFSYHNARVFAPLIGLIIFLTAGDRKTKFGSLLVVALALLILVLPASRARSNYVGILDAGAIAKIENLRNSSTLPTEISRLAFNRPAYLLTKIASNYADYFSPVYLFVQGGSQYQFSVPNTGLISLVSLPFFYLGVLIFVVDSPIILLFLLLSPLPAAITQDRFAVVRSTTMIPFVYLAITAGVNKINRKFILFLYLTLTLGFAGIYVSHYFSDYPKDYSQSWQYGYAQAISYVQGHQDQYDQIIFTKRYGEAHEFVLWYEQINPRDYLQDLQTQKVRWDYHDAWYWVNGFGKFTFVDDWSMSKYVAILPRGKKYLIISSPENTTAGKLLTQINFLDGKPAFIIKSL